jgi:hypothetical protein
MTISRTMPSTLLMTNADATISAFDATDDRSGRDGVGGIGVVGMYGRCSVKPLAQGGRARSSA